MANIVVCHGAWGGSWAWRRMWAPLRAKGHELFAPTYTGLGDRFRFLSPSVGLSTHIEDVVATIFHEDLTEVILVGHSYGGLVATGVADREPGRIAAMIYLDAFVPDDGQCGLDFQSAEERERVREIVEVHGWCRRARLPRTSRQTKPNGCARAGCPSHSEPSRSPSA